MSFEQLEHYLGGILWGAKNDQVGVIFSVILLVLEISITASEGSDGIYSIFAFAILLGLVLKNVGKIVIWK